MTDTQTYADWTRRLRNRADRIIAAFDAMPAPATPVDVARQARAVAVVRRMADLLFGVAKPRAKAAKADIAPMAADDPTPDTTPVRNGTTQDATAPMNRQQRRHFEALARKKGLIT